VTDRSLLDPNKPWQRALWWAFTVAALALTVSTVYLAFLSRRPQSASAAYQLAYLAFDHQASRIMLSDLTGARARPLSPSAAAQLPPSCAPAPVSGERRFLLAYIEVAASDSLTGTLYLAPTNRGQPVSFGGTLPVLTSATPAWSPDAKQLIFATLERLDDGPPPQAAESGVFMLDTETSRTTRIGSVDGQVIRLSWSSAAPLVILTWRKDGTYRSALADVRTGQQVFSGEASLGVWSPTGLEAAAYSGQDQAVFFFHSSGRESTSALPTPGHVLDLLWLPHWPPSATRPRGRLVALIAAADNESDIAVYACSLDAPSPTWTRLQTGQDAAWHVAASPEGRYLAVSSGSWDEASDTIRAAISVYDLGSARPLPFTPSGPANAFACFLAPASTAVAASERNP